MMRGRRYRRMLTLGPLAAGVVVVLFGLSLWHFERENAALEQTDRQFEIAAHDLLATIGFVGMIHDFKNCVIRADEPEYCEQAQAHAAHALELMDEIERLAARIGLEVRLDGLRRTVSEYRDRAALVREGHARGLDIRSIDDAVRYDDSAAAREIEATLRLAQGVLGERLERLRWIVLAQTAAGILGVLAIAGWFSTLVLREHRLSLAREDRLSAVFGAVSGGVIALDRAGRVAMTNPQGARLLAREAVEPPYAWPEDFRLCSAHDAQPLPEAEHPVRRIAAGETIDGEVFLVDGPGIGEGQHYLRISGAPLDRGQDLTAVLVAEDVTEQEHQRQQLERNSRLDALGQLSGGIAHDFNNMLATILYAIDLALKEGQSARSQRLLRQALSSVERGRNLTTRLLSFAKRQPGLTRSREVAEVFRDFEELARPSIEASIAIHIEPPDPGLMVHCDQSQLDNALLNLALNSRDAIRDSGQGGQIRISARGVTSTSSELRRRQRAAAEAGRPVSIQEYRYVEIAVIDDGPGMPEAVRRRATDPFFTTKAQGEGTGLGLAMAYGFARQAQGEMQIYSDDGHGTTVRLILPRGTAANHREGPVDAPAVAPGTGETILLAEDEPGLLSMMSEVLTDLGYRVETATSGDAALERVRAGLSFDLLLSDMVMPGRLDGLALAREIRQLRGAVPVVLMSGYAERISGEADGPEFPVLQKPCMPDELSAALRDALTAGA